MINAASVTTSITAMASEPFFPWFILALLIIGSAAAVWAAVGTWRASRAARTDTVRLDEGDAHQAFNRELDRARRHDRPLAIVRIPVGVGLGATTDLTATSELRRTLDREIATFRRLLRTYDVVWAERDNIFLLLPELNKERANLSIERMRRTAHYLIPAQGVQVVAFPEDGITAGALQQAIAMGAASGGPSGEIWPRPSLRTIIEAELGAPMRKPESN